MAQLLGEVLLEIGAQGPAPIKDYYYFTITKDQVVWRWWKVSLRLKSLHSKPGEVRMSHDEYLDDRHLQTQVETVFGSRILQYSMGLCQGHYDFLHRLSDSLLLKIMAHLELEDIAQLALTCHRFNQLCSSETFWEQTVHLHCDTVSPGMEDLAQVLGWRRVFFTNKLQLQKQISRRRVETNTTPTPDDLASNTPEQQIQSEQAIYSSYI